MGIYVRVNGTDYPAEITGRLSDKDWNGRASKAIKVTMPYATAVETFVDDVEWSIVQDVDVEKETGINEETGEPILETVTEQEVWDNSEYNIAGDITDHRDGTVTVKMGKPTAEELLTMLVEEVL